MKIGRKAIEEDGECLFCDKVWAVLGLIGGAIIVFTSVDLLTGGALTRGFKTLNVGAEPIQDAIPEDAEVIEDDNGDGDE